MTKFETSRSAYRFVVLISSFELDSTFEFFHSNFAHNLRPRHRAVQFTFGYPARRDSSWRSLRHLRVLRLVRHVDLDRFQNAVAIESQSGLVMVGFHHELQ